LTVRAGTKAICRKKAQKTHKSFLFAPSAPFSGYSSSIAVEQVRLKMPAGRVLFA
jgi:hypothetical protein